MTAVPAPPATAPPASARWGLGDAAVGWVVVQAFSVLWAVGVLAVSGRSGENVDDLPLSLVAIVQAGLALAFFGVPYVVTKLKGNGLVTDLGLAARGRDLWRGGLAGVVLQVVVVPLLYAPLLWLLDQSVSDLEAPARSLGDRVNGAADVLLLVVIVGVMAPVFEEIFYRGLVQRALLKRGLSPGWAVAITALVFAVSHLQLLQLPGLVVAGLVFGGLAQRSGRLGPAIAAHVGFNMVTVVALTLA